MSAKIAVYITQEQKNLLQLITKIKYGEARVVIRDGQPVRIESAIQGIQLDDQNEFGKNLETILLAD